MQANASNSVTKMHSILGHGSTHDPTRPTKRRKNFDPTQLDLRVDPTYGQFCWTTKVVGINTLPKLDELAVTLQVDGDR